MLVLAIATKMHLCSHFGSVNSNNRLAIYCKQGHCDLLALAKLCTPCLDVISRKWQWNADSLSRYSQAALHNQKH